LDFEEQLVAATMERGITDAEESLLMLTPNLAGCRGLALVFCMSPYVDAVAPVPSSARYGDSEASVFLDDEVTSVFVEMDESDLTFLLSSQNAFSRLYKPCTVRVVNSRIDETVASVGMRLRGNTSRTAKKKSWKLSFNEFMQGRRFHGVKKFNLNGEHNDVSICRSTLTWKLYRNFGVPGARTNHVHLKINDGSRVEGVHVNVEQIDDDFVDAWFGSDNGNLYKCTFKGARADLRFVSPGLPSTYENRGGNETGTTYQNEINNGPMAFTDLADFIAFVNQSSDSQFAAELGDRFNVDTFLRAMAADVVMGHWDNYWYGANNYYLYNHPLHGRFEYIPFDVDNSVGVDFFGINWANRSHANFGNNGFGSNPDVPPLIRRVLAVPSWEQQFRRYLLELVGQPGEDPLPIEDISTALGSVGARLDPLRTMLAPLAYQGTFSASSMDWSFSPTTFDVSFSFPESFMAGFNPRGWGLGPYLEARGVSLRSAVSTPPSLPPVRINEVVSANVGGLRDEVGDLEDWFELYNDADVVRDIGGLYLTEDPSDPKRWMIPEDTTIGARDFLLIWADDEVEEGPLHANFRLANGGETLALFDRDPRGNVLIDVLSFPAVLPGRSYGRFPDGSLASQTFLVVTPRDNNDDSDVVPVGPFLRGDCNRDGTTAADLTDVLAILFFAFVGQPVPPCLAACDVDADGVLAPVLDALVHLQYSFLGLAPPPAPFPLCGSSALVGDRVLGCESVAACEG
jgi:hypothetical protein